MGIQGLLPFLKKSSRPVSLSEFKGKTAAVDVYCWLHKGAFSCAEKLVKGEPTDGYIVYVMKQVNLLLSFNIKPILVFDGCHLPAKEVTELKRRESRAKNRRKAKELLREGKVKEARECFQRCVDVTSEMAREVIRVCRSRNVDTIVAPYEADAELAFLNLRGIADIVITEDSDLVLFGCDKIIFKLDSNGGGMLIEKEKLHVSMNVPRNKFDFVKFRNMCILSGCDYLPSLHGIGLAKSCRFFVVTSNPDVFTALCKLPANLKMPNLEVSLEYRKGFMKAIDTILHQLVFDPLTRTLRPLTSYPDGATHEDMPYCGKFVGHERALQIALGNVDVQTGQVVDNYDPLRAKRPEMKSSSWAKKGDLVSEHPSIWDPNFEALMENYLEAEAAKSEKKDLKTTLKDKERVVQVSPSVLKRKREELVKTESEISEDMLEFLYCNKKTKLKLANGDASQTENDITSKDSTIVKHPRAAFQLSSSEGHFKEEEEEEDVGTQVKNVWSNGVAKEEKISEKGRGGTPRKNLSADQAFGDKGEEEQLISNPGSPPHAITREEKAPASPREKEHLPRAEAGVHSPTYPSKRNPFAKKASDLEPQNPNPVRRSKFSALEYFSKLSPKSTVVRSRYFRETPSKKENCASDAQSFSKGSPLSSSAEDCDQVLSPLKPSNIPLPKEEIKDISSETSVEVKSMTVTPEGGVRRQSSFNWKGRLSESFTFRKKDSIPQTGSSCPSTTRERVPLRSSALPVVDEGYSVSAESRTLVGLETPPNSQTKMEEVFDQGDEKENSEAVDILTPREEDDGEESSVIPEARILPGTEPFLGSVVKGPPSVTRTPRTGSKCRISGLRKGGTTTPSTLKQRSLKDMFGFQRTNETKLQHS